MNYTSVGPGAQLSNPPLTGHKYERWLVFLAIAIPLAIHYFLLNKYAVDVPYADDYAILGFMNDFVTADWQEKLRLIFTQHLEHRIALTRLFFVADHYLFGQINFKTIILLGNTGLIACAYAVYRLLPEVPNKVYYFLPIPTFLISGQHYESAYWAMASVQNLFIVAFITLTLVYLEKGTWRTLILAMVFATLALFTSGSGVFVVVCGTALLLFRRPLDSKLLAWLAFSVLALAVYFYKFAMVSGEISPTEALIKYPDRLLGSFLAAIGGAFNFEKFHDAAGPGFGLLISMIIGLLVLFIIIEQVRSGGLLKRPLYFSLLACLLLSLAAASMSRLYFGADYTATASRYKINSIMIFIVCYLMYVPLINVRYVRSAAVIFTVLAIVFNVFAFKLNRTTIRAHQLALLRSSWLVHTKNSYDGLLHFDPPGAKAILMRSAELKVFTMPDLSFDYENVAKSKVVDIKIPEDTGNVWAAAEVLNDEVSDYFLIDHGWAIVKERASTGNKIFVVLKAPEKTIVFEPEPEIRTDVSANLSPEDQEMDYNESGYRFFIGKSDIPPLKFRVGIMIVEAGGTQSLSYVDQWIDNTFERDSNSAPDIVLPVETNDLQFAFDVKKGQARFNIQNGWAFIRKAPSPGNKIFLVLRSEGETLIFDTTQENRADVTDFFRKQEPDQATAASLNYDECGFNFKISRSKLQKAKYIVGLLIIDSLGNKHFQFSDKNMNNAK